VGIHGVIQELDLREELEQLFDEDPNISEIDLREEFAEWFIDYDPNKQKRNVNIKRRTNLFIKKK